MDKDLIKNVIFGLVYHQDNLSRHTRLFNALYDNRCYLGELSIILDELMRYKLQKRPKIDCDDIAKINGFWILHNDDILNDSVRKMVYNWIDSKWGKVETAIMLSLLDLYPEQKVIEFAITKNEISNEALTKILENSGDGDSIRLIQTGYKDLDASFDGGLELANLVILAAPTGSGKTSVAVNMCINMAKQVPTAYLMAEQDKASIGRKFFGVLGKYRAKVADTYDKIERTHTAKYLFDRLVNEESLYVYTTKNRAKFTIEELLVVITQLAEKGKKVFFIDNLSYIDAVHNGKRYQNFPDFIKNIVIPELNSLCSKVDCLLVVLAQVNNEVAKNRNMSITLNQIMGGQDSVQAAYGVITIHYPYWFLNQQQTKNIPTEYMRYSILKALKVRELSDTAKQQFIYSEGDYFRAATDDEIIDFLQLKEQLLNG